MLSPISIVCDDDMDLLNVAAVLERFILAMDALETFVYAAGTSAQPNSRAMEDTIAALVYRIQQAYQDVPQLTADVKFLRAITVCIPHGRA